MKKLTIFVVIALCIVLLVACSGTSVRFSGQRIGCIRSEKQYSISLQCESFKGTATYTFTTDDKHAEDIHYSIEVTEGTLKVQVFSADGSELYSETYEKQEAAYCYKYDLTGYGKYKIKVTADGFKGKYYFDWEDVYEYGD